MGWSWSVFYHKRWRCHKIHLKEHCVPIRDSTNDSLVYKDFCKELKVKSIYSNPRYPQSNGQTEATNKSVIYALKKWLSRAIGKWVEKLPRVMWAHRTMQKSSIGETPFNLLFGMESMIPIEIGLPTLWTSMVVQDSNKESLKANLD